MRLVVHIARLVGSSIRYGFSTRRWSLVVLILTGILLMAVTLAVQTVAPLALYPFA